MQWSQILDINGGGFLTQKKGSDVHHHHHHHHRVQTCTSRGFAFCCCCCNPSVRKNALLTRLSVRILHSPCLCVVSFRLLSRERSSLCACFRVTELVLFCCPSLPRYRWNHAESRVAQEQACCASSRTPGGATRSRNRGAEKAPHFASRILSPWSNDAEKPKATERVEMWRVPALDLGWSQCWYCGSYGSMEQKGRILGDAANLESACKEDITATLRHHESLLKSMNAGALEAARDAIASRIEILKQAIYAKEPFHVQLVKVQAALTRAEEVAEKKHRAVWTAREAADKADQHVLNLRQRMAERGSTRTRTLA